MAETCLSFLEYRLKVSKTPKHLADEICEVLWGKLLNLPN